jgi:hypothetical protein
MLLVKDHNGDMFFLRIVEVEFYVRSRFHSDPYMSSRKEFFKNGHWYIEYDFDGYMQSIYVTLGDCSNVAGYMIIRSVTDHHRKLIEGPYNVLKFVNSISDVSQVNNKICCDEALNVRIVVIKNEHRTPICMSPRVSLNLNDVMCTGDERFMYVMRSYRFTIVPHRLNTYKHILFLSVFAEGKIPFDDLCHLFDVDQEVAKEWLVVFDKGRKDTTCKEFLTMTKSRLDTVKTQCQAYGLMG